MSFLFYGFIYFYSTLSPFEIWSNSIKEASIKNCAPKNSLQKKGPEYIEFSLGLSRDSPRENRAENFSRGILPWRAGESVDWHWVACPSWPFRLHHPNTLSTAFLRNVSSSLLVICNSRFSSSFPFAILPRLPSFSSLPKTLRTSHSSSRNFSVSDASCNVRWDSPLSRGVYYIADFSIYIYQTFLVKWKIGKSKITPSEN